MNHTEQQTEQILEFHKIREKLENYACTRRAKEKIRQMEPFLSRKEALAAQRETTEARRLLDNMGNPPFSDMEGVEEMVEAAEKGGCLTGEQLEKIESVLTSVRRLKEFLNRSKYLEIGISYYEENLDPLEHIRTAISESVRGGRVEDSASKLLRDVRSELVRVEEKMREKADSLLRIHKNYMSDNFCTTRNGRLCLPVKKEYRGRISGSVIDQSATGNTLFMEPEQVAELGEELSWLRLEEENEVRRILYELTGLVADAASIFARNQATMEKLDFLLAKGRLSVELDGIEPEISQERKIFIKNGRHPLMDREVCVPLNFRMGEEIQGVIITGPNTGGKTVSIKTVGLLSLMAQCGLHVSCEEAQLCMNSQIFCDIGDGQNLSQNLSTFSAHITNVLDILRKAGKESLVILDELGSGTDPTEGMGIAIAILEELRKSGALYLVTTHYPEVKNYGERTQGVINARMAFDRESLKPLYRLEIGRSGDSCAFYIAKKLGMPGSMLLCANRAAYGTDDMGQLEVDTTEELRHERVGKLQKEKNPVKKQVRASQFELGDSVLVYPDKKIGIVCQKANEKGVLRIQMPYGKIWVNHKRLKLHVAAAELYPEDYDFSIIFESVENRKMRHDMERKYVSGAEITVE